MPRPLFLSLALVLCAAGCTDQRPSPSATAPKSPRLTRATLPANASSVCAANVTSRDRLLATADHARGSAAQAQLAALDAVIDDVCY